MPFLNSKVLNINVARAISRLAMVDHGDGRFVVLIEDGRTRGSKTEFSKDRAKIFGNLGGTNSSNEFSLSRTSSHGSLELGLESNSATCETKNVSCDRTACLQVSGMSCINVASKLSRIDSRDIR